MQCHKSPLTHIQYLDAKQIKDVGIYQWYYSSNLLQDTYADRSKEAGEMGENCEEAGIILFAVICVTSI